MTKFVEKKSLGVRDPDGFISLKFLGFSKRWDYTPGTRFDRATCAVVVRDEFRHWASSASGAQNTVFRRRAPTCPLLFLLLLMVLCCSLFRLFFLWSCWGFLFLVFLVRIFSLFFFSCAEDVFYVLFFSWRFCHGRSVGEGFETSRSLFRFSWVDFFCFLVVVVVVVREGGLGGSLDSGRGWMSCRGRSWRGWCFSSRRERRRLQTTRDHPMILM